MDEKYTEIVGIDAPSSVSAGEVVNICVRVKNIYSVPIYVAVMGRVDTTSMYFGSVGYTVGDGVIYSFYDSFIMPSSGVKLYATSLYKSADGNWVEDDEAHVDIALSGVAAAGVSGRFTKGDGQVEIYNPTTKVWSTARPVVNPGQTIRMRVEVQNTSIVYASMKVESRLHTKYGDFPNFTVADYSVGPGSRATMDIGCVIPDIGDCTAECACYLYVVAAGAYPWPTSYNDAKSYNWCTIRQEEVIIPAGEIIDKWVNKETEGNRLVMPASVDANGESFEIGVKWKNTGTTTYDARIEIVTRDPDGQVVKTWVSTYYGMSPGQSREKQENMVYVNKTGEWTTIIKLVTRDGFVLDEFGGACLNATGLLGRITSRWFNQGSHRRVPFQTVIEADGQNFEVGVQYVNETNKTIIAGVKVEVWGPEGLKQPTPIVDYTGLAPNEELQKEYQFGSVDKSGEWTTKLQFIDEEGYIIDEWEGILFTAIPVAGFSDLVIVSFSKKTTAGSVGGTQSQQLIVSPGDTIAVDVRFKYTSPDPVTISLMAALWIPPGVDYPTSHAIQLGEGVDAVWTGSVEIPITDSVGLRNDTYHLLVSLPDYGVSDQADNAVICEGMPAGIGGILDMGPMLGMLVMVMIMSMIMNMMSSPEGFMAEAGKTYEKVKKVAEPAVHILTRKKD